MHASQYVGRILQEGIKILGRPAELFFVTLTYLVPEDKGYHSPFVPPALDVHTKLVQNPAPQRPSLSGLDRQRPLGVVKPVQREACQPIEVGVGEGSAEGVVFGGNHRLRSERVRPHPRD